MEELGRMLETRLDVEAMTLSDIETDELWEELT